MYNSSESTCVTFILTTLLQRQHPAMYVRQQGVSPPAYLEADPVLCPLHSWYHVALFAACGAGYTPCFTRVPNISKLSCEC